MWEKLVQKFKDILEDNTLLTNVYDFEPSDLEGTPIATIVPSGNDSDYATTTENERIYAFTIRLYAKRLSGEENERNSELAMRELVDSVLDDLDKNHRLTGLSLNTGYCYLYLEATPSSWIYIIGENGYRIAELSLRVHFDVDVTLIS